MTDGEHSEEMRDMCRKAMIRNLDGTPNDELRGFVIRLRTEFANTDGYEGFDRAADELEALIEDSGGEP